VGLATGFTKGLFRTITAPIGDALDLVSSASSAWSGGLLRAASSSIEIAPRTVHRAPLPVRYCDLKYSWKLITPTGAKIENVIARAECVVIGQSAESPGLLLVTHTGHICVVINDDYVVRSSVVSFETQRMADKGLLSNGSFFCYAFKSFLIITTTPFSFQQSSLNCMWARLPSSMCEYTREY